MRELESSFDESTSAMEKNRKKSQLLNKQIESQEKLVSKLEEGLSAAEKAYGKDAAETKKWQQAVNNAKTDLNKLNAELKNIPSNLTAMGNELKNAGEKMKSIGDGLTKYVSVPLTAMAAASVAAWNEVDEGMDIVVQKTGATGEALASLQQSAINIAETIPTSFETAGEAIGEVNTRFGLTGTALEELATQFIEFAELNNTDVSSSIDNVQKLMAAYGVETEDAGKVLDVLNKTGQDTGISMETLMSSMNKNAAAMQEMGLDAYDAAQFLGQVETSGADTSVVMTGLKKALTNAAKAGKSLPEALKDFQSTMQSSASDQEKLTAAIDLFGKNAGPAIYNACKTGSLSFESLSTDASTYLGSVKTTFENTLDPADEFKVALNKAKVAGSKLGGTLLEVAAPAIESLGDLAESAGKWFDSLTDSQKDMVSYASFFAMGVGPVLSVLGSIAETAGKVVSNIDSITTAASGISGIAGPIALAVGAFAGLSIGLTTAREKALDSVDGLRDMLKNTASATDELNAATDKLKGTINGANNNIKDIDSKAATADKLIEELYKLDSASNKTADDQARMKVIVGELNSMYPGLALSIDDTTGSLNKGKEAVKGYVDNARDLALIDAYAAAASETITKLAESTLAYNKAIEAQQAGQQTILELQEALNKAIADSPIDTTNSGYWDEMTNTWHVLTPEIVAATEALDEASKSQADLNAAVDEASEVMATAEGDYNAYVQAEEDLKKKTKGATDATETQTDATEDLTDATEDLADATEDAADETKKLEKKENQLVNTLIKTATMVGNAKNALKEAGKAAKAAGEDYQKSKQQAKDSLQTQIGLFDAYEERAEVNIQTLIANAHSREQAYADYADNLQKLMQRAEQSGSETVKAYAAKVSEMGMVSAEELAAIVNATDEQLQELADADYRAELHMDFASEETAYALNGFMTEEEKAFATFGSALSTNLSNAIGNSKIWDNFKTNSKNALDGQKTYWKNNNPEAKVSVSIPDSKTLFGKKTAIQKGIGTPNTSVSVSTPDKSSLLTKKQAIAKAFTGLSATVSIKTSGASDAGRAAARSIKNAAGTVYIPVAATRTNSALRPYATGGFVDQATPALVGEDGPEVIIPLSSNMRARALDLFQQAGEALGVQTITAPTPSAPTARIPDRSSSLSGSSALNIDFSQLYDAVASAARAGMQSANIKVYWNNREAGRIMKNMGVQFA